MKHAKALLLTSFVSTICILIFIVPYASRHVQHIPWSWTVLFTRPVWVVLEKKEATGTTQALPEANDDSSLHLCEHVPVQFGKGNGPTTDTFTLCPEAGIITVEQGGRLGNQMWEYASVWALAQDLVAVRPSLKPFVPRCLRRVLDDAFPYLSVPELVHTVKGIKCAHGKDPVQVHSLSHQEAVHIASKNNINEINNIVLKKWIALPEFVLPRIQQLKDKDFLFQDELVADSRQILLSAASNLSCKTASNFNPSDVVYVGVHVRRTDYHHYLMHNKLFNSSDSSVFAKASFFHRAMEYFRVRLKSCIAFLVVSDDTRWCTNYLTWNEVPLNDVFVVTRNGVDAPLSDLALLASCNHSIIDYGSFGVWGALLAGGNTLVYHLPGPGGEKTNAMQVAKAMPTWQVFPP